MRRQLVAAVLAIFVVGNAAEQDRSSILHTETGLILKSIMDAVKLNKIDKARVFLNSSSSINNINSNDGAVSKNTGLGSMKHFFKFMKKCSDGAVLDSDEDYFDGEVLANPLCRSKFPVYIKIKSNSGFVTVLEYGFYTPRTLIPPTLEK